MEQDDTTRAGSPPAPGEPRPPRRILRGLGLFCALLLVGGELLLGLGHDAAHGHGGASFEGWPGFHALIGFVACLLLVLAARPLRALLLRGEDYHGD